MELRCGNRSGDHYQQHSFANDLQILLKAKEIIANDNMAKNKSDHLVRAVRRVINLLDKKYNCLTCFDLERFNEYDRLISNLAYRLLEPECSALWKNWSKIWIVHCKKFINFAMFQLNGRKPAEALDIVNRLEVVTTMRHLILREELKEDEDFSKQMEILKSEIREIPILARTKKALVVMTEARLEAMSLLNNYSKPEFGFKAISGFSDTQKEFSPLQLKYPEIWAEIQTEIGLIYLNLIGDLNSAKINFEGAKNCQDQLGEKACIRDWFRTAIKCLEEIAQKLKIAFEEMLINIQLKRKEGEVPLVEHILQNHPPIHSKSFNPEDWKFPIRYVDKKIIRELIRFYHTDKLGDQSEFDQNYFRIVEDIAKCLGGIFNNLKAEDWKKPSYN